MAHLDHFNMELGDSKMKRGGVRIVEGTVVHIGSAGQQELHSLNLGKRWRWFLYDNIKDNQNKL